MNDISGVESTIEAHLDTFLDNTVSGWVWDSAYPEDAVVLHLFLGTQRLGAYRADRFRPDLKAQGIGSGHYGFSIEISPLIVKHAETSGEALEIRSSREPERLLFAIDLVDRSNNIPDVIQNFLSSRLDAAAIGLKFNPILLKDTINKIHISSKAVNTLFTETKAKVNAAVSVTRPTLFFYAEHVRRVRQLEATFNTDVIETDIDHFIQWYLFTYGRERAPRRAPLSRELIRWLNESITIGGKTFAATRAMLWCLAEDGCPHELASLGDPVRYAKLVYWWAAERAPSLNVEDCLVSRMQVEFLRQVPQRWSRSAFPLSHFMEEALQKRPSLAALGSMLNVSCRRTAYLVLLVEAIDEPGLLRFLPKEQLDRFFADENPFFDEAARQACCNNINPEPLTAQTYRQLLAHKGFNLDKMRFTSLDLSGNRSEVARLGSLFEDPGVDVQVIGPMTKISGIAQACRLSYEILRRTSYNVAFTDFAMDNLQPQQESLSAGSSSEGRRARVNLFHLNADMLPIAFAYMPDLHVDAYRIGFFFWELDKPADCHRLALDLVDEIWVASDYNQRCFAAWTSKPVINIGMAIDVEKIPDRITARAELCHLCGIDTENFVFLYSYDSLSYVNRKNPLGLLHAFMEAFADDDRVRLVIKTHNAAAIAGGSGAKIWDRLLCAAAEDPRVIVINETLSYATMINLKAGSDCYVSLHRSEGLGFGMLEAMRLNVPVVCTAYSGNMDFCDSSTAWLVEADEVWVRPEDYAYVFPGHRWAEPRHASAIAALRNVRHEAGLRRQRVEVAAERIAAYFSLEAAAARYSARLDAIIAGLPSGIG